MSYVVHVSDETYKSLVAIAAEQGQRPETLAEAWLKERAAEEHEDYEEHDEATPYSQAWLAGLDVAIAQAQTGQGRIVESTDELLHLIDAPAPPEGRA